MRLFLVIFSLACVAATHAYKPSGKFDLSEDDLDALCKVVDPKQNTKPEKCMYMKWVTCKDVEGDKKRPCGWYEQTRCPENSGRGVQNQFGDDDGFGERRKREANEHPGEPVFLSWPESK